MTEQSPFRYASTWLLSAAFLASTACLGRPEIDVVINDSPQGAVYLERIPNRSFQAAHPIKIPTTTIAQVLRGVLARNEQGFLQTVLAGKPDSLRAFSEEQIAYLAPLISDGLARAAPDQRIGIRLSQAGTFGYSQKSGAAVGSTEPPLQLAPQESTKAFVYAYGRSLYLTFTQYRLRPETGETINMANRRVPDSTGLANYKLLFVPEAARRPDSYRDALSTDHTLVLDYEMLAGLPPESPTPSAQTAPAAVTPSAGPSVQEPPSRRDPEIDALRKELEEIKRQLAEQEAERTRKKSTVPK